MSFLVFGPKNAYKALVNKIFFFFSGDKSCSQLYLVLVLALGQVYPVADLRPGYEPSADLLGTDRPRAAVHADPDVPADHPRPPFLPHLFLHEVRPRPLLHQRRVPRLRRHTKTPQFPQEEALWNQQVLMKTFFE